MNAVSQIIVHGVSLLTALFIGLFFSGAYNQAGYHAARLLNGKPLPPVTQFFVVHPELSFYLILLPWFWLVGGPLLTRTGTRRYWDVSAFVGRYLAFIASEFLIVLLLTLFLFLPYVALYGVMRSSGVGALELTARLAFWGMVVSLVSLSFYRFCQTRPPPP